MKLTAFFCAALVSELAAAFALRRAAAVQAVRATDPIPATPSDPCETCRFLLVIPSEVEESLALIADSWGRILVRSMRVAVLFVLACPLNSLLNDTEASTPLT